MAGTVAGTSNTFRRDVLGDAPVATPACKAVPLPPAPSAGTGTITLSAAQLQINQRIGQAAIRRAGGLESRLDAGLTGGDIRGGAVTQGKLYDRLQVLAAVPVAEPAPASR